MNAILWNFLFFVFVFILLSSPGAQLVLSELPGRSAVCILLIVSFATLSLDSGVVFSP